METRLKEVFAFVNNKGGVAKTTSVQNVAAGMLRKNPSLRILVIDLDPQCNLSSLMNWSSYQEDITVYDSLIAADADPLPSLHVYQSEPGLYFLPASPKLADIERALNTQMQPKLALSTILGSPLHLHSNTQESTTQGATVLGDSVAEPSPDSVAEPIASVPEPPLNSVPEPPIPLYPEDFFDYILIDCPPALSILTFNALAAATAILIPVELGALSVDGIGNMLDAYTAVKRRINKDLVMRGLFIVKSDERPRVARETIDILKDTWGAHLLNARVRQCVKIQESQWHHLDIFKHAPECNAAKDYAALVNELITDN